MADLKEAEDTAATCSSEQIEEHLLLSSVGAVEGHKHVT